MSRAFMAIAGLPLVLGSCARDSELLTLYIVNTRMGEPGDLYCNVPETGWCRQGYPHIDAAIYSRCNSSGPLFVEIVAPEESKASGSVDALLKQGQWTIFQTPSFREPKEREAEIVVAVRTVCDGKPASVVARCDTK